jgi:hypothetical protein
LGVEGEGKEGKEKDGSHHFKGYRDGDRWRAGLAKEPSARPRTYPRRKGAAPYQNVPVREPALYARGQRKPPRRDRVAPRLRGEARWELDDPRACAAKLVGAEEAGL